MITSISEFTGLHRCSVINIVCFTEQIAERRLSSSCKKPVDQHKPLASSAPGAEAVSAGEVASTDIVIMAMPLHKYTPLDAQALHGKTVVDAMNYWAGADGQIADFAQTLLPSSQVVAGHHSGSHVTKSSHHVGYHELEPDASPAHTTGRRALAVAGDNAQAKANVLDFIHRLGFDCVDAGALSAGRQFEPGNPLFNGRVDTAQLSALFADSKSQSDDQFDE